MAPHKRKRITISILVPFLVIVLFFSIMLWQKYRLSHEAPVATSQTAENGRRTVTLFFTDEGTRLAREARTIDSCESDSECLKSVLDELLNGPVGEYDEAVPEGTVVTAVKIEGNLATIEFNDAFVGAMPSGSSAEMQAVYAVVNTVAVNFHQIEKVKINVDGNGESVLHHLDLSEPLLPDYSLEQLPQSQEENRPPGAIR